MNTALTHDEVQHLKKTGGSYFHKFPNRFNRRLDERMSSRLSHENNRKQKKKRGVKELCSRLVLKQYLPKITILHSIR